MMKKLSGVLFSALFLIICSCSGSGTGTTTYNVTLSPVRSVWPIVRESSAQWEIVGEGFFKNVGTEQLTLQSVNLKVFDSTDTLLADRTYTPDDFDNMIVIVLMSPDGNYSQTSSSTTELGPTDIAFCHVAALAGDSSIPARAQVTVSFTNGKSETTTVPLQTFDPGQQMVWPLSFSNGNWLAFDTGESPYHWRAINYNPALGDFVIDQRYAIDAVQLDSQFSVSDPPGSPNKEDYYAWGEDILSSGAGTVIAVEHDQIDQEISKIWTEAEVTETNVMGNYIVIQHDATLFSLYVHMMRSSATVSVGDHVVAGQVIGKVGNSGLTGNIGAADGIPHLHFQFMDSGDRSKAQGLPARFWNATVERHSNSELLDVLGYLPDFRLQNYGLTAGTYPLSGATPLEYDIITGP